MLIRIPPPLAIALLCITWMGPLGATERELNDLVERELARLVAAEVQEEPNAKENRAWRAQTYAAFSHATRKDLFVFFGFEGYGGGEGFEIHLAIFSRPSGKSKPVLHASGAVGSKIQPVEIGYVRVVDGDFYLRSDATRNLENVDTYGTPKLYYRWRVTDGKLARVEGSYIERGGRLVAAQPRR